VSENQREKDFERESCRLSEGLKSCRAVVDNYRAMMASGQDNDPEDGTDLSNYVTTTAESDGLHADSELN
jgi:hypothetical protein